MATDKGQSIALLARIVILEDKRRFSSWLSDASSDPILCLLENELHFWVIISPGPSCIKVDNAIQRINRYPADN